ncbi:hypothetical protein COLO4_28870, partial [Corchorus olitorius]
MRKSQGFVTNKYSAKLKVGSPRPKSGRFNNNGGKGSFRAGGSISRRSSPLSVTSGVRGGGLAQLSYSATNSHRQFRHHVDNMVLWGRPVARAILFDDTSCEVLSRNPGLMVPQSMGGGLSVGTGPRNVEKSVEYGARSGKEGSRFEEECNELYGDLGISNKMGAVNHNIEFQDDVGKTSKGKAKQLPSGIHGDSSADSSAPSSYGGQCGQQQYLWTKPVCAQQHSAAISVQSIPVLGGPNV